MFEAPIFYHKMVGSSSCTNKMSIQEGLEDYPDVVPHHIGPSRGDAELDIVASNIPNDCVVCEQRDPLCTEDGSASDHNVMSVTAQIRGVSSYTKRVFFVRKRSKRADDRMRMWFKTEDWAFLNDRDDVNDMVDAFVDRIDEKMNEFYPSCRRTAKSTDPPWMTHQIKKRIKSRKKTYRREGNKRGTGWRKKKKETARLVKEAKNNFYMRYVEQAKKTNDPGLYYKAVNQLKESEAPKPFNVTDLFPGRTENDAAERAADYFVKVAERLEPLKETRMPTFATRPLIDVEMIRKRLRSCRKPRGLLRGDIWPDLVSELAPFIAIPLAKIFDASMAACIWPNAWKLETVSIIPKKPHPENLGETRNISCTPLFSKVLEFFVLEQLKEEISPSTNQFGGVNGSGTNHYLAKTWTTILENLDQENSACALISIDFAKAFNSMSHSYCLKQLTEMGGTDHTVAMVRAFLTGRMMQYRAGSALSSKRALRGGAPQGTLLGNYLFILTTNNIEEKWQEAQETSEESEPPIQLDEAPGTPEKSPQSELITGTSTPVHPVRAPDTMVSSPDETSFEYFREYRNAYNRIEDTPDHISFDTLDGLEMNANNPPKNHWKKLDDEALKYVDDILSTEHMPITSAYNIFSTHRPEAILHARGCQTFFNTIKENASEIGMTVNDQKTQLLCINAVHDRKVDAYIRLANGARIEGQDQLKQLGFVFGRKPGMRDHLDYMSLKFRRRLWYLRHLRSAGLSEDDLKAMYRCFLLSVLDYACVVYGPMLTQEQEHALEMLQSTALKIIYGIKRSYEELIELSGLERLVERRERLTDKFIKKASENPRMSDEWFPLRPGTKHDIRNEKKYAELFARTDRLYKSPIYSYRRRLNYLCSPERND